MKNKSLLMVNTAVFLFGMAGILAKNVNYMMLVAMAYLKTERGQNKNYI